MKGEEEAGPQWNRMTSGEVDHVLSAAREMPELSPRQLASWVTDNHGLLGIIVYGLPHPAQGGAGEEA